MSARHRLPDERRSLTHKFTVGVGYEEAVEGFITVGLYEDGKPGEMFVTLAKKGAAIAALTDLWAASVSLGLQHGIPLEEYIQKAQGWRFEPGGRTSNPDIPTALSIVDYIARWLELKFLDGIQPVVLNESSRKYSGIFCPDCGGQCAMQEGCLKCLDPRCGWSRC